MPLPKYYCDYCDKQFQYTTFARKRHCEGLQHQRAKAFYYDSLKDPNRIQGESFGKGICNHFIRTGFCQYGDSCKYFHPKPNLQSPSVPGAMVTNFAETVQPPIAVGNQIAGRGGTVPMDLIQGGMGVSLGNLPPSLRPPPEGGYPTLPFVDWG
ncbi:hypothetical protein C5167_017198 [Papaver somniferum]|uniref:C3H1-type domain-containing protein n=1 Tax=Papaver somniferum TaxID=3469 RepID=A0A4Y7IM13_PAPSO|nr:zinc finger CCCH domain-containing protein 3-like [Papaver somniferum]RZC48771.1 hypothetical protein C5167_017198 [Papaver somniferum]